MPTEALSEQDLRGTRVVYGLLGDARFEADATYARSLTPFHDLAPGDLTAFLYRIGLDTLGGRRKSFSSEKPGELAWEAHVALNRGLEVAENWPQTFVEILDMLRTRSGQIPSVALLQSVGAVERWLVKLPVGDGAAIRRAAQDFREAINARRA